jgi:hypothetical protein
LGKKHNLLLNFSRFMSMVVNKLWQQTHLLLTLPAHFTSSKSTVGTVQLSHNQMAPPMSTFE